MADYIHSYMPLDMLNMRFRLRSFTDPKITYIVSWGPKKGWACTCPDFVYRHRQCKHIVTLRRECRMLEGDSLGRISYPSPNPIRASAMRIGRKKQKPTYRKKRAKSPISGR